MDVDVPLCVDCGSTFEALQSAVDALGEPLSIETLVTDLCSLCRSTLYRLFDL